jgi:membrane protease YdiL (CAAX protease family)
MTINEKILRLIIFYLLKTVLIIGITFINYLLIESGVILSPQHHFSDADKGLFTIILMSVIIAPIMEEITFRGWLIYNRIAIAIVPAVLFVYFISPHIFHQKLFDEMTNTIISLFTGTILSLCTYFLLKKIEIHLIKLWNKNTRILLFISAVLFGYVHIFNYNITLNLILFSPFILLPFIVGGLIIGYIRIRMGFFWGLTYHVTNNLIPILITILLK